MERNNSFLISTVIPYCNPKQEFFKDAIYSVLAQSYQNWEMLIVNDGSTEESKSFLKKFINSLNEKRISIIHLDKNSGVSFAKNKGIESSKGEIISFLDADDLYLPWYFEEIAKSFQQNPNISILAVPDLCYYHHWKQKKMILPVYYETLLKPNPSILFLLEKSLAARYMLVYTPRLVLKRNILNVLKFDIELKSGEDTDLCYQILNTEDLLNKIMIFSGHGYLYRIHSHQGRLTQKMEFILQSRYKIFKKYQDKDSMIYKIIKNAMVIDRWKFCKELADYSRHGSISDYLKSTFSNFKSVKDKIKSIRVLIKTIWEYRVLSEMLGLDILNSKKLHKCINKTKEIKECLYNYSNNGSDINTKTYSEELLKSLF
ncbi:MAG: hypothetical protein A3B68_08280 [Candidatus Melainabacteria bacterium RIFCSPHIGHO2_02_FULL_34_12]|nr:MAG: hypothetical protein A3B68_08280 [Candidatus Melainabacteria bacterium RIFCSPHIGHO2_02_FULL_34_12]